MIAMRKQYTTTFKSQVVLEILKEEKTLAQIASEHGVHPTQLRDWKAQALSGLTESLADKRQAERATTAAHARECDELYIEIGQLTTQLTWLKKKSGLEPPAK
jgi:transposase-like protein